MRRQAGIAPSPGQGEGWDGGRMQAQRRPGFDPLPSPSCRPRPSQRLGPAAGVLAPQDPSTSGRSPCPGAGARTSVARTLGVMRSFTMRNVLLLESGPLHPDAWVRCGGQVTPLFPKGVSLVPISPSVRHVASRAVTRRNPARQRRPDTKPALTVDRPRRRDETSPMRCTRHGACELRQ